VLHKALTRGTKRLRNSGGKLLADVETAHQSYRRSQGGLRVMGRNLNSNSDSGPSNKCPYDFFNAL
jgi:hypothetical protein